MPSLGLETEVPLDSAPLLEEAEGVRTRVGLYSSSADSSTLCLLLGVSQVLYENDSDSESELLDKSGFLLLPQGKDDISMSKNIKEYRFHFVKV